MTANAEQADRVLLRRQERWKTSTAFTTQRYCFRGNTGFMKSGHVYIMANRRRGKTYLGVSSKLPLRVYQHKNGHFDGYTKDKGCDLLVWHEFHEDLQNARQREAQMKKWKRDWKLKLVDAFNPDWVDLYHTLSK